MFEEIIAIKINKSAESKNILNQEQSDFRNNRSTTDHLLQFVQNYQQCKQKKIKIKCILYLLLGLKMPTD